MRATESGRPAGLAYSGRTARKRVFRVKPVLTLESLLDARKRYRLGSALLPALERQAAVSAPPCFSSRCRWSWPSIWQSPDVAAEELSPAPSPSALWLPVREYTAPRTALPDEAASFRLARMTARS